MIKAVLFDLDGTLLDRASSLISFARQQYRRHEALQLISQEDYVSAFVVLDDNGQVWKDEVYQQLIELYGLSGVTWEFLLQDYVENFAIACIGFPNLTLDVKDAERKDLSTGRDYKWAVTFPRAKHSGARYSTFFLYNFSV